MGVRLKHFALLTLPALATAVSLSEFTPSAMGLSSACEKIYTGNIPGCTSQDFSSGQCSDQCIKGVESLVGPIKKYCGGAQGENLIVAFLQNIGPQQICPNAPHFTPGPGPIGPPPMSQSGGGWSSYSPATTITSGIETVSTAPATYSKSLLVDTSSQSRTTTFTHTSWTTSLTTAFTTRSSATTTASSASTSASSGAGNHGGSPLDIAGNTAGAASLSLSAAVLMFSAGVAVFTSFQ